MRRPLMNQDVAFMRWQGRRGSSNVEDRRRSSPATIGFGGGILGLILLVAVVLLGGDPRAVLQLLQNVPPPAAAPAGPVADNDPLAQFVSVVLADTEEVWTEVFAQSGERYRVPTLVLYRERVASACGLNSAATGPFYCPGDSKVYLDLSFFEEMKRRFRAPGDFAQAYVVAHEVGHHVQNLLGLSDQVHAAQNRVGKAEGNQLSVRLELQADFLAGVWAHHADEKWRIIEPGDVEEALRAATAIGDDRLQKQAQGYVVPESFTHGTSEQRRRWFLRGLDSGTVADGDTFALPYEDL